MSEVSYQAFLTGGATAAPVFVALPEDAIGTREKDAKRTVTVGISKRQAKWLERVASRSGDGIDQDAVVRALIDLGGQLEIDWELLAGSGQLRAAIRDAVRVRRTPEG